MENLTVRVRRLDPRAVLPTRSSPEAAGADLCAVLDAPVTLAPSETALFHTGLALELPVGWGGFVFARSGLSTRDGLAPANKVGVVDSDYRGEVLVALHNHGAVAATVTPGQRIAQLVLLPVAAATFCEAESLTETVRGAGGFGSTGT